MGKKECMECGEEGVKKLHNDPRRPPLEEHECLCDNCLSMALTSAIEECQSDMDYMKKWAEAEGIEIDVD